MITVAVIYALSGWTSNAILNIPSNGDFVVTDVSRRAFVSFAGLALLPGKLISGLFKTKPGPNSVPYKLESICCIQESISFYIISINTLTKTAVVQIIPNICEPVCEAPVCKHACRVPVPGEDKFGQVTVHDPDGDFLYEPEVDLVARSGTALFLDGQWVFFTLRALDHRNTLAAVIAVLQGHS